MPQLHFRRAGVHECVAFRVYEGAEDGVGGGEDGEVRGGEGTGCECGRCGVVGEDEDGRGPGDVVGFSRVEEEDWGLVDVRSIDTLRMPHQ